MKMSTSTTLFILFFMMISSSYSVNFSATRSGSLHFNLPEVKIPILCKTLLEIPFYIVELGFGTPKQYFDLLFDTGSYLTWIQCKPCEVRCFNQKRPVFDPSLSFSYAAIPCHSIDCSLVKSVTYPKLPCSITCKYFMDYHSDVSSMGDFAREVLHLSPNNVIPGFIFGCGQNNSGSPEIFDGILGIQNNMLSLVDQASSMYGRVFSFCLPSEPTSKGFLMLGGSRVLSQFRYTPLVRLSNSERGYNINLVGVGTVDQNVSVPHFPVLIDTGSRLSLLPSSVYVPLRSAVRKALSKYTPIAKDPENPFDTCYETRSLKEGGIPPVDITLQFEGGVDLKLPQSRVLQDLSLATCIPIVELKNGKSGILGGIQLQTLEVLIDVANSRMGFAEKKCG
ncbi:aspartyl protease family protein At5g10770-like [Macadamia integrifolia]|uniref:aspartyl protease family protein At5g10770-like n=1 Tax=Macadamia integrifolia TaxID=60698 RepID=UPI001C4FFBB8|nr:aspartyl protease family protein At5g10770-like [Macadamia integrifolia]